MSDARASCAWLAAAICIAAPIAHAAQAADSPTVVVAPSAAQSICVEIDGAPSKAYLDCLSAQLASQAQREGSAKQASMDAVIGNAQPASPNAAGVYNQTATRELLGSAFGNGVRRPPVTEIYPNPLAPPPVKPH